MAFTEFYCQNGGSNLNAGSTTNNTAAYTALSGDWDNTTKVYTVKNGTNPSLSVTVGDFASVYIDGATVGVYIGRVTAVTNAINGTITVPTANSGGTAPATGTATRTIKVGGAWQGPNAASIWPFTMNVVNLVNTNSDPARINLRNDQTYSMTTAITVTGSCVVQGYSSSPGDGGRPTITAASGTFVLYTALGSQNHLDLILTSSQTTGVADILACASTGSAFFRITASGGRGNGFNFSNTGLKAFECEAYDCNKSNTVGNAGFKSVSNQQQFWRCIAAANSGSNTDGFTTPIAAGDSVWFQCISHSNGRHGFASGPGTLQVLHTYQSCDSYNNAGDGLKIINTTQSSNVWIENCNFIKNTGWGVNAALTTGRLQGFMYNCGFGSGSMVNGSGTTNNTDNLIISGSVTYASGATPWNAPGSGDFRIILAAAMGAGRGSFTETQGGYSGTIGYPDIGAAQHDATLSSLGREVSYGFGF